MTKNRGLTLHRNGTASVDGVQVGQWWQRPVGPGYTFSCACGTRIYRFGLGELRDKIEIHLDTVFLSANGGVRNKHGLTNPPLRRHS